MGNHEEEVGSEGLALERKEVTRTVLFLLAGLALFLGTFVALAYIYAGRTNGTERGGPVSPAPAATLQTAGFTPPSEDSIPSGPQGDAIRRGREIFLHTGQNAEAYVGSGLSCGNCHLDGGRTAESAPMWAAWVSYPAYRKKNDQINTMEDRIKGCFVYSMNAQASPSGGPPPAGDDIYRDLESYFAWLATNAPTGGEMKGRGFRKLADAAQGHDPKRGAKVFADNCAACHGANGQGQKNPDGGYLYPPLWGEHSYNWGAGMTKIPNAAGFIKANMPFGNGDSLTDQEAWDVAAFIDSHERPRDPREKGDIAATRRAHHSSADYYGQTVNGDLLGDGKS